LTMCVLTDQGRAHFLDYLAILEQVLRGATQAMGGQDRDQAPDNFTAALNPI
jgi:hypothetical protein